MKASVNSKHINIELGTHFFQHIYAWIKEYHLVTVSSALMMLSLLSWIYYSMSGLHLTYNDAMSHLDIARRVTDNIKPGLSQLGSVWLPLPHVLMLPTIWMDPFWRTGLAAGIISMASFILTGLYVYKTVRLLGSSRLASLIATSVIALNPNFLYLQTTALTEPLFMALFSMACYYLVAWTKTYNISNLIFSSFFVCLATLTRYDGWFLLIFALGTIFIPTFFRVGWQKAKGLTILFGTLGSFGVLMWFLYNQLIFGDAFFFAFSEFSAKSQQDSLSAAGGLPTKGNLFFSLITYYYAMIGNIGFFVLFLGFCGWLFYILKNRNIQSFAIGMLFLSPILFNIIALFLGHSVIYLPETKANSWFNVRYGLIALPTIAIFIGYLLKNNSFLLKTIIFGLICMHSASFVLSNNIITITDGVVGASHKNVAHLGEEILHHVSQDEGLILASAASHDAILFTSTLPMKQFIHEGAGKIWDDALRFPDRHAEYILMRSNDKTDSVSRAMMEVVDFEKKYTLIYDGDFADLYKRTAITSAQNK